MKRRYLAIVFLIITLTIGKASSGTFQQANEAYKQKNYIQALNLYSQLINQGIDNPYLFYNIGNTFYKLNQPCKAICFYKKALRLLPRNKEIKQNLQFIQTSLGIKEQALPWWNKIILYPVLWLTINELSIILAILGGILAIWLIFYQITSFSSIQFKLIGIISLIIFIFTAIYWGIDAYNYWYINKGIIIKDNIIARSGPGEDYMDIVKLREGTQIIIRTKQEGWFQINISKGVEGWIPQDSCWKI